MTTATTALPIEYAFILAAGEGRRLRPYTDQCPKPMVSLGGKTLIDHIIDKLIECGVKYITVNLHYMADMLAQHLKQRDDITITLSYEESLLDTGGGIANALHTMQGNPFFIISGDSFWIDTQSTPTLPALQKRWQEQQQQEQQQNNAPMDMLLLLQPISSMTLTHGVGDYRLDDSGRPVRMLAKDGTHMFTSIRICHPRLFDNRPAGAFSFLELMDKAEAANTLHALENKGEWHHISTPQELERVQSYLQDIQAKTDKGSDKDKDKGKNNDTAPSPSMATGTGTGIA